MALSVDCLLHTLHHIAQQLTRYSSPTSKSIATTAFGHFIQNLEWGRYSRCLPSYSRYAGDSLTTTRMLPQLLTGLNDYHAYLQTPNARYSFHIAHCLGCRTHPRVDSSKTNFVLLTPMPLRINLPPAAAIVVVTVTIITIIVVGVIVVAVISTTASINSYYYYYCCSKYDSQSHHRLLH